MSRIATLIGPADDGRAMSLQEFDLAEGQAGHLYELARGVVAVIDIPKPPHLGHVTALRRQFATYDLANPGRIHTVAGGGECKILLSALASERHPDLAIYLAPPPDDEDPWSVWLPAIVIEVVSPGSEHRDYVEKREEYLQFGVQEYWIVDARRQTMLVLRRSRGAWLERVVQVSATYSTRLLPGFKLNLASVFQVAGN